MIKSGVLGHAIGDAMGVPNEFKTRKELQKNPITTMIGYGTHKVPAGSFSDDTSMVLATMDSFIMKKGFDYDDIMQKFALWVNEEIYTPQGKLFDIGLTCSDAIYRYIDDKLPPLECGLKKERSNGNGSLMRILPIAYYAYYKQLKEEEIYTLVKDISSLTHAHEISVLGCYIYVQYVLCILKGYDKHESYKRIQKIDYHFFSISALSRYKRILKDNIDSFSIDSIKSGGYVVDTLEAVFWVLLHTESYKDAIIVAINLGEDTDTVGAIIGGAAGILYGYDAIPKEWLDTLYRKEYIIDMCDAFEKVVRR